jgi:hypothetical protein
MAGMKPEDFIAWQQASMVWLIVHFWWLWLLLVALGVGLRWLWENYYDV